MDFMLSLVDTLPKYFDEASHSKEHGRYMHGEYHSLMKDDVWNLVEFPITSHIPSPHLDDGEDATTLLLLSKREI